MLRHFDMLYIELKKRLKKDVIALGVLDDFIKGKSREEIICKSGLEPEVVDEAFKRIRKISREIQKELEDREKQNAETDDSADGQYPTNETLN